METASNSGPTKGVVDELFSQLPLWACLHILFGWADLFSTPDDPNCSNVMEFIGDITILNFHHYLEMDQAKFLSLANLPFSSRLAHLDLSESNIGKYPTLVEFLSHPIFQHLVTLNLNGTQLPSLDPLFARTTPHNFPNLHTLDLSNNSSFKLSARINPNKFPQLKVLDLRGTMPSTATLLKMFPPPPSAPTSSSPDVGSNGPVAPNNDGQSPPYQYQGFHLEQLWLTPGKVEQLPQLFTSPTLSQLRSLLISNRAMNESDIKFLFGADTGVLKHLTHLHLMSNYDLDDNALCALAQSAPYLSNLTTLQLSQGYLSSSFRSFYSAESTTTTATQALIQSPYLWSSQLKHLVLDRFPTLQSNSQSPDLASLLHTLGTANVTLETFDLGFNSIINLDLFSSSSCLSQLKSFSLHCFDMPPSSQTVKDWNGALERLEQSPNLSNLTNFSIPRLVGHQWTHQQLVSLFTSPMMSNDLVELDLSLSIDLITDDFMEAILTARLIPGDETSPFKFGKLQKLQLSSAHVGPRTIELIVQNLPHLIHLDLSCCRDITDAAITALIGHEHDDPHSPYPALPNLTHLDLYACPLTEQGLTELSKSQLLDQLNELNLPRLPNQYQIAFMTTPLFSNMRSLRLRSDGDKIDTKPFNHLQNCNILQF